MAVPPEIDHAVIAAPYQFRMATAEQLRVLHTPDSGPEQMRRRPRRLNKEGLVDSVVLPQAGKLRAWFLTEHAVRIAATFPELEGVASPPLPEDKTAARLRPGHVLAVVRTHVAFVTGARAAGDGGVTAVQEVGRGGQTARGAVVHRVGGRRRRGVDGLGGDMEGEQVEIRVSPVLAALPGEGAGDLRLGVGLGQADPGAAALGQDDGPGRAGAQGRSSGDGLPGGAAQSAGFPGVPAGASPGFRGRAAGTGTPGGPVAATVGQSRSGPSAAGLQVQADRRHGDRTGVGSGDGGRARPVQCRPAAAVHQLCTVSSPACPAPSAAPSFSRILRTSSAFWSAAPWRSRLRCGPLFCRSVRDSLFRWPPPMPTGLLMFLLTTKTLPGPSANLYAAPAPAGPSASTQGHLLPGTSAPASGRSERQVLQRSAVMVERGEARCSAPGGQWSLTGTRRGRC